MKTMFWDCEITVSEFAEIYIFYEVIIPHHEFIYTYLVVVFFLGPFYLSAYL